MALLDSAPRSAQRISTTHIPSPARKGDGLHPAMSLAGGFGFIIAGALAVHVIFNALI
jgi:hypothetical protein